MEKGKRVKEKKFIKGDIEIKKKKIIRIFIGITIVLILGIAGLIASDYIIFGKNTKTNLVINNNNITFDLKHDIIFENDVIYLSKGDKANFFDKYIYEEESINKNITT